jgi:hypothetical protein
MYPTSTRNRSSRQSCIPSKGTPSIPFYRLITRELQRLFAKPKPSSLLKRGKSNTSFSRCFLATHEAISALPITIQLNGY